MKNMKSVLSASMGTLFLAASAQATVIDFGLPTDLIYNTTDPVIGSVSFWAGDPNQVNDTFVDDGLLGDNYLLSGVADGYLGRPTTGYDTFIGVSKTGIQFGTASFKIASFENYPNLGDQTTLLVEAYLGNTLLGTTSLGVSDNDYHTINLGYVGGFDSLRIYDDLNSFDIGASFRIDDFTYADYVAPAPGGGGSVPEPSVVWLLGAGLMGLMLGKRRQAA
jgi:hypothetical protein